MHMLNVYIIEFKKHGYKYYIDIKHNQQIIIKYLFVQSTEEV